MAFRLNAGLTARMRANWAVAAGRNVHTTPKCTTTMRHSPLWPMRRLLATRLPANTNSPIRPAAVTSILSRPFSVRVQRLCEEATPAQPPADGRLLLAFTCNRCQHRSAKHLSRRAYLSGVVIVQCDGCKSKHLIADHLGWFRDQGVTVEDLVREKGETATWLNTSAQALERGSSDATAVTDVPPALAGLVDMPEDDLQQLAEAFRDAQTRLHQDQQVQSTSKE